MEDNHNEWFYSINLRLKMAWIIKIDYFSQFIYVVCIKMYHLANIRNAFSFKLLSNEQTELLKSIWLFIQSISSLEIGELISEQDYWFAEMQQPLVIYYIEEK